MYLAPPRLTLRLRAQQQPVPQSPLTQVYKARIFCLAGAESARSLPHLSAGAKNCPGTLKVQKSSHSSFILPPGASLIGFLTLRRCGPHGPADLALPRGACPRSPGQSTRPAHTAPLFTESRWARRLGGGRRLEMGLGYRDPAGPGWPWLPHFTCMISSWEAGWWGR